MTLNDQAILAEWSNHCDDKNVDEWQWQLNDLPTHICEAFGRVANAANAAATARTRKRGGGGSVVVIDGIKGGGRREGRLADPVTGAVNGLRGKKTRGRRQRSVTATTTTRQEPLLMHRTWSRMKSKLLHSGTRRQGRTTSTKLPTTFFPTGGLTPLRWLSCGIGLRSLWQNFHRTSS